MSYTKWSRSMAYELSTKPSLPTVWGDRQSGRWGKIQKWTEIEGKNVLRQNCNSITSHRKAKPTHLYTSRDLVSPVRRSFTESALSPIQPISQNGCGLMCLCPSLVKIFNGLFPSTTHPSPLHTLHHPTHTPDQYFFFFTSLFFVS